MKNNDILEKILASSEEELKNFSKNAIFLEKEIIKDDYQFAINWGNERTLAYLLTKNIENELLKNGYKKDDFFIINEFDLILDKKQSINPTGLTKPAIEEKAKKSQKSKKKQRNNKKLTPDTFLAIRKNDDEFNKYFIEYKADTEFDFLLLSLDLLKFQYYTNQSKNINSFFVYVLINRKVIKSPTLKNNEEDEKIKYQFLNKNMTEEEVDKNAHIFLTDINFLSNKQLKLNDLEIYESASENIIELSKTNIKKIINYNNDHFEKNWLGPKKGSNNVVTADIILDNYKTIFNIYSYVKNNKNSIILPENSNITIEDIYNADQIIQDSPNFSYNQKTAEEFDPILKITTLAKHYFDNFLNYISPGTGINRAEYTISKRRSLWIILIFNKFCIQNNLEFRLNFESNKNTEELIKRLEVAYNEEKYQKNLNLLSLEILFCIVNFYETRIDKEKSKEKIVFKEDYNVFKLKNSLTEDLKKIYKLNHVDNSHLENWDIDLNEEGISFLVKILNQDNFIK